MIRTYVWTCVMDYRGGTYIRQVTARTPEAALRAALLDAAPDMFPNADCKGLKSAADDIDDATPIEGMKNVFCVTTQANDHLMMAHVVKTATR